MFQVLPVMAWRHFLLFVICCTLQNSLLSPAARLSAVCSVVQAALAREGLLICRRVWRPARSCWRYSHFPESCKDLGTCQVCCNPTQNLVEATCVGAQLCDTRWLSPSACGQVSEFEQKPCSYLRPSGKAEENRLRTC